MRRVPRHTSRILASATNAPGSQGCNRYAHTANNPTTWTDPSGHSIGDAGALQAPIRAIAGKMQTLGTVALALMPVMLALGPFGGMLGLVIAFQFLQLAMLLLMVIVQMLAIMQDPFSYYDGDAPTERGPEWTAEELEDAGNGHPEAPGSCSLTTLRQLVGEIQAIQGAAVHTAMTLARECALLVAASFMGFAKQLQHLVRGTLDRMNQAAAAISPYQASALMLDYISVGITAWAVTILIVNSKEEAAVFFGAALAVSGIAAAIRCADWGFRSWNCAQAWILVFSTKYAGHYMIDLLVAIASFIENYLSTAHGVKEAWQ